jgi:hypothetical protein
MSKIYTELKKELPTLKEDNIKYKVIRELPKEYSKIYEEFTIKGDNKKVKSIKEFFTKKKEHKTTIKLNRLDDDGKNKIEETKINYKKKFYEEVIKANNYVLLLVIPVKNYDNLFILLID